MQNSQLQLPLEIQLQAACTTPRVRESYNLLISFLPALKELKPKYEHGSQDVELYREYVKKHFNFTAIELIEYLKAHPETCKVLLGYSYDKRYTSATFIQEWQNQYRVGWVPSGHNPINQIRVFSNFAEATADYVLFSWGFPRLTSEQANWIEVDHY